MYATVPIATPGLVNGHSLQTRNFDFLSHTMRAECELGQSEVQNLRLPALCYEGFGQLDVAMHDTLGMRRIQRGGKLDAPQFGASSTTRPATPSR